MEPPDVQSIAKKWIDAFNRHDIKDLLSLYSDGAVHYSPRVKEERPETQGWLRWKQELRAWWQRNFDDLPGLQYSLTDLTADKGKVFMEYERRVPGQEDRYVMEYLRIENGVIVESRVLRSWPLSPK